MQNLERLTLAEMRELLAGSRSIALANQGREQIYRFVERVLAAQHYRRLGKRQKGIVRRFLAQLSGLSRAQLTRLMGEWLRHRRIEARQPRRRRFPRRCTPQDIALLAAVDAAHEGLSGPRRYGASSSASISCLATRSTSAWPKSGPPTSTTCSPRGLAACIGWCCIAPRRGRSPSPSGANPIPKDNRLSARRYGAPGPLGRPPGSVSQHCRYGHPVARRRLRQDDLGAASDAGAGSDATPSSPFACRASTATTARSSRIAARPRYHWGEDPSLSLFRDRVV